MITGLTNMIILILLNKPDKSAHKLWKHLLYLKFLLMLPLHSPVLKWLLGIFGSTPADVTGIQFFLALLLLLISVGTRHYREDVTKNFSKAGSFQNMDEGEPGIQMQRLD